MIITTRFELAAPIEAAWAYLLDVPKIARACTRPLVIGDLPFMS